MKQLVEKMFNHRTLEFSRLNSFKSTRELPMQKLEDKSLPTLCTILHMVDGNKFKMKNSVIGILLYMIV